MNEKLLSMLVLSITLISVFLFIVYTPSITTQQTVPCKWLSDKIIFGGRADYYCYLSFSPESSGTYAYYLAYPGNITNLKYAKIGVYDVQTPIDYVNISGSLPPNQINRISLTIPEGAYDIVIYGEIIGKSINNIYPNNPYIKGGNYDLTCGIQCKYNKGVIIDRPGTYTLEIYSGTDGNGIDYRITGSYKLPSPSLLVTYDTKEILNISNVNYVFTTDITNEITSRAGYLTFEISGKPKFRIVFESTMTCSLYGGEWSCKAFYQKGTNKTTILCERSITSTCNFEGLLAEIPLDLPGVYSKYFSSATNAELDVLGKIINVQPGSLSVVVAGLPEGSYYIKLSFELPYLIPEAKEVFGKCIIDKTRIEAIGQPGQSGSTTISIYNMGDESILVRLEPSDNIVDYVSIRPIEQVISPKSSGTYTLYIKLPELQQSINGYIKVYGCAEQPIQINVQLSTSVLSRELIQKLPSVVIAIFLSMILLLYRDRIEKYIGKEMSYVVTILLMLFIIFILLFVFPITL
mgnify:CR=1 FL=1